MQVIEGVKITNDPSEISDFLKKGMIVISESISHSIPHSCIGGIHTYTLGKVHETFIEKNFPSLKLVCSDLVCIYCTSEKTTLKRLAREMNSLLKKASK